MQLAYIPEQKIGKKIDGGVYDHFLNIPALNLKSSENLKKYLKQRISQNNTSKVKQS